MPRGSQKKWHPSYPEGVVQHDYRFVNPMPTGALPDTSQQHRGSELNATEHESRGGYHRVHQRSIADFFAVKGAPINGKGNKATKKGY